MPGFVTMEMDDRLAIVTINRPDALNALNAADLRELSMAIEHLSMAQDVGAIILTGAGDRAFVAGADIKEMANLSGLEMQRFSEMGRRLRGTGWAGEKTHTPPRARLLYDAPRSPARPPTSGRRSTTRRGNHPGAPHG